MAANQYVSDAERARIQQMLDDDEVPYIGQEEDMRGALATIAALLAGIELIQTEITDHGPKNDFNYCASVGSVFDLAAQIREGKRG